MKELHILHLYPNEMNTYGDRGNLMTLVRRCHLHGYRPIVHYHHPGNALPPKVDIVLGGGGQDSSQTRIQKDLQKIAAGLHKLTGSGTPMLMVCGTYQLFGHRFVTQDNQKIKGISIFNAETFGSTRRMIGNIKIETNYTGLLVGFENHSGRTILNSGQQPFGYVLRGSGNNGEDKTEGARTHNVFGTYMHGPVLPNNPKFTELLLRIAATNRYGRFEGGEVDDSLALLAREGALKRHY